MPSAPNMAIPNRNEGSGISPMVATSASILYTLLYVGVIYISPTTRPSRLGRNHHSIIKARIRAATIVTILCIFATSAMIFFSTGSTWWETLSFMGITHITPSTLIDTVSSLLLTAVLFVAPLFDRFFAYGDNNDDEDSRVGILYTLSTWIGWRNYVAAPLTEEIVFRSCMVPLHIIAGVSPTAVVFLTPIVFGIAHFHHAYEVLLNYPGHKKLAVVSSFAQFTHTTLFGWYAVFILLRTGSVWPVVFIHTFCNWIGPPGLTINGPKWMSFVYYTLLLGGAWGFFKLLWPLTQSANALVSFV